MKLFDARPNVISTFGLLRIKQFKLLPTLTFQFFLKNLHIWCIKQPKNVLDLMHLKKDGTDASVYKQLFIEIRDGYCDYIPVHTDGSRDWNYEVYTTVFPANIVISMRLPDSTSIFTGQFGQSLKPWKKLKIL